MPLIAASRKRSGLPTLSVRAPAANGQRGLAFNAVLSRSADLQSYRFVAVDHNPRTRKLTFFPTKSEVYQDTPAHRLIVDGPNAVGRVVYLRTADLSEEDVPTGRYPAEVLHGRIVVPYGQSRARSG